MGQWSGSILKSGNDPKATSAYEDKLAVARQLCGNVSAGDVIGAGSGSTSLIALHELARIGHEKDLRLKFIPTSYEIEWACQEAGVETVCLNEYRPDWCFDGADEVDPQGNMIKGRGGAMYREKLVMRASERRYILVDSSKFVGSLGEKFPIPVEFDPGAAHLIEKELTRLGAQDMQIREAGGKDGPVVTEKGNAIIDVKFNSISGDLEKEISAIPGVLESGLFWGYAPEFPGDELHGK